MVALQRNGIVSIRWKIKTGTSGGRSGNLAAALGAWLRAGILGETRLILDKLSCASLGKWLRDTCRGEK